MFARSAFWALAAVLLCAAAYAEDAPAEKKTDDDRHAATTEETAKPEPPKEKYNPFSLSIPLSDEEDAPSIKLRFFGQHRTRYEIRTPATYTAALADQTSVQNFNMRTRLGVDARFPGNANFLFELQDVRLWGDEPRAAANTVNSSGFEGLDVLQAYFYTTNLFDLGIEAYVGRQKFTVGNQRLISTLEWSPASRAWDGIRIQRSFFDKQFTVMALAMLINDLSRVRDDEWMLGLSLRYAPNWLK
ncbi:MAG: alginate export family protein, partial [Planctomycetes bacterium]|nr:alginate export family protein [Planctomycetota bacterium]